MRECFGLSSFIVYNSSMEKLCLHDDTLYLIPSHATLDYQKLILEQQVKGVRIESLEDYILSHALQETPTWTLQYEIYHRFKNLKESCPILGNNCTATAFIKECLSFLSLLHTYQVPLAELPDTNDVQKELKQLISSIYDCPTLPFIMHQALKAMDKCDAVICYNNPSFTEKYWINFLIQKGAQVETIVTPSPSFEFHHSNNPRQEIESCAQRIIQEGLTPANTQIYTCDSTYTSLIQQVFSRYEIPLSVANNRAHPLTNQALALFKFALRDDAENYNTCITQHCFGFCPSLQQAQEIYPYRYDEDYPEFAVCDIQGDCFSEFELERILHLIQKANEEKQHILPYLSTLTQATSIHDLCMQVDLILRTFNQQPSDQTMLRKIQNLICDAFPFLHEKEDLTLLMDTIQDTKEFESNEYFNAFSIKSIRDTNFIHDNCFILGASQKNFPNFKPMSGVFDESYVEKIPSFPTLENRYQHITQSMIQSCHYAHHVMISYPLNDYLGKSFESSLEIETLTQLKSVASLLIRQPAIQELITSIEPSTAQALYTKDHHLRGSVSSLEKYVGCPYAYFLRYGCKIQEPLVLGFDVAKIGTLNHSILENLVNKYGKDYAKDTIDEAIAIIDQNLQDMKIVFPHLEFQVLRQRLMKSMENNLNHLFEMENHSALTPTYCERKFETTIPLNYPYQLDLIGYIDRIDVGPTTFRIVDYKSSQKKLEKEKVFSGQQLQLCTYLIQMNEELQLRPLGAFYYSFLNPKLDLPYQKMNRRSKSLTLTDEEICANEMIKKRRLQGWIFDDNVELMDDNASHVLGVSISKDRGVHAKKVLEVREIRASIHEMMRFIASSILSGNVNCEPNEAACMFCKYHSICRFQGAFTEKPQLVDYPNCMRKEEAKDE